MTAPAPEQRRDPTLLGLARSGSWWARAGALLLLAGVVLAVLVATVLRPGRPEGGAATVRVEGDPGYTLDYARGVLSEREEPRGGLVLSDAETGGEQASRLVITPLELPAYEGSVTGALPLTTARVERIVRSRWDAGSVRVVDEGLVGVGPNPAYQLSYVARRDGDLWFGRAAVVAPLVDGVRRVVLLDGQEEQGRRVATPRAVGRVGDLRLPMRSFRFLEG